MSRLRRGQRTGVEPLKLVIFHLMQRHLSDILRSVAVCNIYYYESSERLFDDTKTDDLERRVWLCIINLVRKLHRARTCTSVARAHCMLVFTSVVIISNFFHTRQILLIFKLRERPCGRVIIDMAADDVTNH